MGDSEIFLEDRKRISEFLNSHNCYTLIPRSGKIVVFDMELAVKSAFIALLENNLSSAPIWDSEEQDYVGMVTVSDFINILLHFHPKENVNILKELEKHRIRTWRDIISLKPNLIFNGPEDSLFFASTTLLDRHVHRLPITDRAQSNTILQIFTHHTILNFVLDRLIDLDIFECSIQELGIGTFENVRTLSRDTPLHQVLRVLSEQQMSAIPIVNENGEIVDVYSKTDVIALVKQVSLDFLDKPVSEILKFMRQDAEAACPLVFLKSETLSTVLKRLLDHRVYRLICVDSFASNKVVGVISLSQILDFFLIR